jgi:FdhD protein
MKRSSHPASVVPTLPRLTQAQAPLTQSVEVVNERGEREQVQIPAERPLTIYVDKRELVTLMTLGAQPELLVLGYLRNQRLVQSVQDIGLLHHGAVDQRDCAKVTQMGHAVPVPIGRA